MKILILCHESLVPPVGYLRMRLKRIEVEPWRTEGFVARTLLEEGHNIQFCGLDSRLAPLRRALSEFKPRIIFNLLEEFDSEGLFESLVVGYLESLAVPVTGCRSWGLFLSRNKVASKVLFAAEGIRTPQNKKWPRIVKFVAEDSSRGLTKKSIVKNFGEMKREIKRLKSKSKSAVFSEEFIPGRELYCGVLKTRNRLVISDLWETSFGPSSGLEILTERAKWDFSFRERNKIKITPAKGLSESLHREARDFVQKAVLTLGLNGPARFDFRYSKEKGLNLIEVNPNPDLAPYDEFAIGLRDQGLPYKKLIGMIVREGLHQANGHHEKTLG